MASLPPNVNVRPAVKMYADARAVLYDGITLSDEARLYKLLLEVKALMESRDAQILSATYRTANTSALSRITARIHELYARDILEKDKEIEELKKSINENSK